MLCHVVHSAPLVCIHWMFISWSVHERNETTRHLDAAMYHTQRTKGLRATIRMARISGLNKPEVLTSHETTKCRLSSKWLSDQEFKLLNFLRYAAPVSANQYKQRWIAADSVNRTYWENHMSTGTAAHPGWLFQFLQLLWMKHGHKRYSLLSHWTSRSCWEIRECR